MKFAIAAAQFGIAWFIGNFLAMPITQIGICMCCSFPLLRKLSPYSDCIDIARCKNFYRLAVFIQVVILALSIWAVVTFAPIMMRYGYFFALFITTITGIRRWGCNETNTDEFIQTLQKYVIPGKDEDAFRAVVEVLYRKH